ncbi:MAG: ribose 5-phosphate isomerase B [Actinomycetota bacterium]
MRIAVGSDHAGFALKRAIAEHLAERGHAVVDLGTDSEDPVDYPSFCAAVGRAVVRGEADRGIVMGGSGQGEAIAANKVHGVRAALCLDEHTARLAREHNDANVLSLGGRIVAETFARSIVDVFLATSWEGGRHAGRVEQIHAIEEEECGGMEAEDE